MCTIMQRNAYNQPIRQKQHNTYNHADAGLGASFIVPFEPGVGSSDLSVAETADLLRFFTLSVQFTQNSKKLTSWNTDFLSRHSRLILQFLLLQFLAL